MRIAERILAAVCAGAMLLGGTAVEAVGETRFESPAAPEFAVSSASAEQGDTVTVKVSVKNNPGIVAFRLSADYDSSVMKVVSVEGASISKGGNEPVKVTCDEPDKVPLVFSWGDGMHGNYTYNGTLLTLKLELAEDAEPGDYAVSLSYDPDDIFDTKYKNVSFNTTAGSVKILCKHDYKDEVTPPTCTEKGYTVHTCTKCHDSYTDSYVDELGHNYEATVVEPTEAEGGYTEHTCSRCGDSYRDSYTPPLGVTDSLSGKIVLVSSDADNSDITVTAVDQEGKAVSVSAEPDGSYRIPVLADGIYSVTASKKMFVSETKEITVAGGALLLDLKLYLYGDCNGDGKVNVKDLTALQKHINGWGVEIVESAADLTGEGKINVKDLTRIQRLINGWDVPLGKQE